MQESVAELSRAILHNQLVLWYQPQFDLLSGKLTGVEALVRWQHPTLGLLLPEEFVPVAEQTGLIVSLGEWVLRHACEQISHWQKRGLPVPLLAVNMASRQLEEADIVTRVGQILHETGIKPEALEIELTETGIVTSESAMQHLHELHQLGLNISLDDFGTGCSGLWQLKMIPLEKIKLGRSYISGIGICPVDEAIICTVIDLANRLGLCVVAEGIETQHQKEFLLAQGCHFGQGFYLGTPMRADELFNLFERK